MPKVKLIKSVIATLPRPPKGKRITYTDDDLPGFALRLGHADGTYYAIKRNPITDKVIFSPIGSMSLLTPAAAREDALIRLRDIHSVQMAKRKEMTGAALVEKYLKEHATKKKDEGAADRMRLEREFVPKFGKRDINTITRAELSAIINRIGNEEGHATAARLMKAVFSKLFNFALTEGIIDVSPAHKLPKFKGKVGSFVLTDREIALTWQHLEAETRPHIRCSMRLCILTVQRRAEVASVEWKEVDLNEKLWIIPGEKTKNGLPQTVPLNDLALAQFEEMRKLTGDKSHVFWIKNTKKASYGPMHPNTLTRAVTDLHKPGPRNLKGVRKFTVHNFRHTGGTRVAELTESNEVVKHILNHKDPSATSVYDLHTYDVSKKNALLLWEQRIEAALGKL